MARVDHGLAIADRDHTRVLLVDLDKMPRQLIHHELAREGDIALIDAPKGAPLAVAVGEVDAHVVVIGRDDPGAAAEVLREHPIVRMLAIVHDSRALLLYELRPKHREVGVVSRELLLRSIRRARKPRSSWMP